MGRIKKEFKNIGANIGIDSFIVLPNCDLVIGSTEFVLINGFSMPSYTIKILDPNSGKVKRTLTGHTDMIWPLIAVNNN